MGGNSFVTAEKALNRRAWAVAYSYYPEVRDALFKRNPEVAAVEIKQEAAEIVKKCFRAIRGLIEAGDAERVPEVVAEIISEVDVWRL